MKTGVAPLDRTVDRFTRWLGLPDAPAPSWSHVTALYRRWCQRVPFDNFLIRTAIAGVPRRVPGMAPPEFLSTAMTLGVGNLCMEAADALCAVLRAHGYRVSVGLCQIGGDSGTLRVNHTTVVLHWGGERFVLDTTLLTGEPIALVDGHHLVTPVLPHAVRDLGGLWEIATVTAVGKKPKVIRLLAVVEQTSVCDALYQSLQGPDYWAANRRFFIQLHEDDALLTFSGDTLYRTTADDVASRRIGADERTRVLTDVFGVSAALAPTLPADDRPPTPTEVVRDRSA
ncbi:arylamine N-acetyltransferase [Saccharothrix variisporea]|uniref:N-acetyltransferase n=1 Tax=Saccharothrix variisporea TaxID=543527 RepID=A0A495XND2_9PSEU|nr:arylamine N-acetyltransferase [Saccharothrix variisporea]RKT74416.1 N-acetyltransferase [Saccharothrix variisporea]